MNERKIRSSNATVLLIIGVLVAIIKVTPLSLSLFHVSFGTGGATWFISIAADLLLCYALFKKKLDHWLVIPVAILTLMEFISFISYLGLITLLTFTAYALMLFITFTLSEQTLIKIDLSKFKDIAQKLAILPGLLLTGVWLYYMVISADFELSFIGRILLYLDLWIHAMAFSLIIGWLRNPSQKEAASTDAATNATGNIDCDEAYCSLGKHIVLCLFTFGIWYMIWIYRTTKFLNKTPGAQQYNPGSKLLLCLFIPFYQIYWFYKHGQRIDAYSKYKNLNNSDMATLCLILGIFIPVVACIIMQDRINALCTAKAEKAVIASESSTTDELKKYKDLLDTGVITQEEFDAKKKQLLGL